MFQKMFSFTGLVLLTLAAIVVTPGPGLAQRGGGGQVGGYRDGYRGGYYNSAYAPRLGYRPYRYRNFYYGDYSPHYNYDPSLYGGSVDNSLLLRMGDGITDNSGYRGLTAEQTGAADNAPAATPADTTAYLNIRVPADAQIWVEGNKTTSTGTVRAFQSPPLTPGSSYTYDIRATWNENGREVTQTQKVNVTAGGDSNVVFPTVAQPTAKK